MSSAGAYGVLWRLVPCAAPPLVLSACNGTSGVPGNASDIPAQATAAVDRATADYYRTKPFIDMLVQVLPVEYAARVLRAQTITESALAAAKTATSAATQIAALRQAEAAMKKIEAVTGP